jgi:type IV pilus assembly protein PilQ
MISLRSLALLVCFAVVGVALAVCVGYSTDTPQPPKTAGEDARVSSTGHGPSASHTTFVPAMPPGPLVATPYPYLAQQVTPPPITPPPITPPPINPPQNKSDIEALADILAKQLQPRPTAPLPGDIPGIATPPAAKPPGETTVKSEGDGLLSVNMTDANVREVLESLGRQGGMNVLVGKSVQGTISATLKRVSVTDAFDAVLKSTGYVAKREGKFVFVGSPTDFEAMEHALDKVGTRVYRPNYVTAAELQAIVQPLLTTDVGVVSVSTPSEGGIGADETNVGGDGFAGADVLVVRDYEAVLTEVDQMVDLVDIRPLQVHIEAMILSVKLKDEDKYGVDFQFLRQYQDTLKFGMGNPAATLADFNFQEGSLKVGFLDSHLGAFLEALESIGDTNVIATPQLMVVNKHRASIQIGDQKGYVSTTVTETTSVQTVEFLEVGTILRLRPFISSDGIIRMEIHPELSSGDVTLKGNFTVPEKTVTQVTSNVMVRDGCTVVIGGLMREELSTTANQIPFLGNLPWVGFAFRSSTETTERREVIVLITPHIVYEPDTCDQGEKMACEFHRRQSVYADKMTPLNKRNIGRRYARLAKNAMAAGDRDRALRFSEMAVHFDPLSREAIDLRSNIWQGNRNGDHALPSMGMTLTQGSIDGEVMPEWLLGDLQAAPQQPRAVTLHPYDAGQPGPRKDIVRPRRLQ